jgi:hypothetical protein
MGTLYGEFDEDSRELTTYKDGMRLSTVRIDDAGAMHDKVCSVMTESVHGEERICLYLSYGRSNGPSSNSFGPSRVIAFDKFGNYKGSRSLKGCSLDSIH